jgi:cytochrome b561
MDKPERYGLVSRVFHWGMAYLLTWQFFSILMWKSFSPAAWVKIVTSFGPYHGTVGLMTILLIVLRAGWAFINRRRRPPREPGGAGRAALAVHVTLYVLMFVIPALALLRTYGRGKGWSLSGIPLIPTTGIETGWMIAPANALHGLLSWTLCALIAGHVVMALHHRFIRRDRILARMAGPLRAATSPSELTQSSTKELSDVA